MVMAGSFFNKPTKLHPLVLIVEADEDTRLMMKYLLQTWKCCVVETADTDEALKITELRQPDFVLFSSGMRERDNLITIRRMRELSANREAKIICISNYSESAVRVSHIAAGADNFLVKPIDFGILEKILSTHLYSESKESKRREMFL